MGYSSTAELPTKKKPLEKSGKQNEDASFQRQSILDLPANELYQRLLFAEKLPKEFSNKKDLAVQQKAIELVTIAILEHGKVPASDKMNLQKASMMGLINLIADDFADAIVRNRAGNVFFDELCRAYGAQAKKDKDYSDYYEHFNDAQKNASLQLARSMRGPGYYSSGSGSTRVATKIEHPRDKNAELAAMVSEKQVPSIGTPDQFYSSMTQQAREALGIYLDVKPQSVDPKFVTDLVDFIVGFGELREVKILREKMQADPSISNMAQTAGYEEWLGVLLVCSAAGIFPWGKAFKGANIGGFTKALFRSAKENEAIASSVLRFSRKEEANIITNASKSITLSDVKQFVNRVRGKLSPAAGFVDAPIAIEKREVLAELKPMLSRISVGGAPSKVLRTHGVRLRNNLAELVLLAKPYTEAEAALSQIVRHDPQSLGAFAAKFGPEHWKRISQLAYLSPKDFAPAIYLLKDKNKFAGAIFKDILTSSEEAGRMVFRDFLDGKINLVDRGTLYLFEKSKFLSPLRALKQAEKYEIVEKIAAEAAEKKAASTPATFALWKKETIEKLDRLAELERQNPGVTQLLYNETKADLLSHPALMQVNLN